MMSPSQDFKGTPVRDGGTAEKKGFPGQLGRPPQSVHAICGQLWGAALGSARQAAWMLGVKRTAAESGSATQTLLR
jgi:hypothetical protein